MVSPFLVLTYIALHTTFGCFELCVNEPCSRLLWVGLPAPLRAAAIVPSLRLSCIIWTQATRCSVLGVAWFLVQGYCCHTPLCREACPCVSGDGKAPGGTGSEEGARPPG